MSGARPAGLELILARNAAARRLFRHHRQSRAGVAADILVRNGGTAILSETPEIYGAEHLLTRAPAARRSAKLVDIILVEDYQAQQYGDNNPSPGNKLGGLTDLRNRSARRQGLDNAQRRSLCRSGDGKGSSSDTPGTTRGGDRAGGRRRQHLAFTTPRLGVTQPTPSIAAATRPCTSA